MKASELIDAIERFFLDLVGTIIPGGLFLAGWVLLFGLPKGASAIGANVQLAPYLPWAAVMLAYVMGHAVTGIGGMLIQSRWYVKLRRRRWSAWLVKGFKSDKESAETIMKKPTYDAFRDRALQQMPWLVSVDKNEFHEWRNIAMSLLTPEERHTAHRFMFISLLNLGAATVPIVLGIARVLSGMAELAVFWLQPWGSSLFPQRHSLDWSVASAGLVGTWFFLERRLAFYERSLRVPFAMGLVKLAAKESPTVGGSGTGKAKTLYLAGGTRSNWQDSVIGRLREWDIIDPRTHNLQDERAYTLWDLDAIRRSDWILAYFEATNPGGYNLALEIGYAKALGKKIIYVDERSAVDENVRRYSGMLRATADLTPDSLDHAVTLLDRLRR